MKFLVLLISFLINPSINGVDFDCNDPSSSQNYIDKIAIVNLILESYSPIPERNDDPFRIGLYNRFENQTDFDGIRCRDLDWGVAYCDLFNVVRFYNKTRFLTTRWFDFEDRATIQLMEVPNFNRVEIFFHFSPVAINYSGKKALVMVRVDEDENESKSMIIGLEKSDEWEITREYQLDLQSITQQK